MIGNVEHLSDRGHRSIRELLQQDPPGPAPGNKLLVYLLIPHRRSIRQG